MTRPEVLALYRDRLDQRTRDKEKRRREVTLVSVGRLVVFASGVALLWFVWETDRVPASFLAAPVALFVALLFLHARLYDGLRRAERAATFYRRGIERLEDRWAGTGRTGEVFLKTQHPYARDLDLFGKRSLFELLATTVSSWGTSTLADWLKAPASLETVRGRQTAIEELRPLVELRERLSSEASEEAESLATDGLRRWASSPPLLTSTAARLLAALLGTAATVLLVGWLASWVDRLVFLTALAVSMAFAAFLRPRVQRVLTSVEAPSRDLAVLATLLEILERESFASKHLVALAKRLAVDGEPASRAIRRLARLIEFLDARRNQLFLPMAALALWGTQFAFALEAWRRRNGAAVPTWLEAVGELDALLALSGYAFENPEDPFPKLDAERVVFDAEGLGHPLIPSERLVRNDVRFGEELRLLVVSGSNMSGKSTLLRSIGVATVLGLAGAPVRAKKLVLSELQVTASIRIEDSLQDGISHFYAEILRLRQVMELASSPPTVLFLLDEILHGTNSHDRRIGAEAVVRGLVERGAIGLITTHDLALAELVDDLGRKAANVHFEDQIEDGQIHFDYVMREGVVKKSNALALMRSIGLEV